MKLYLKSAFIMAIAAVFFVVNGSAILSAQSNALTISPRIDYNLKPGETKDDVLTITNTDKTRPLKLDLVLVDFEAQDEAGSPKLLVDKLSETTAWSIKPFVDLPQQVTVAPSETSRVPISISIPSNTGAGSYYGAVSYVTGSDGSDGQVSIASNPVSLVFVNVPGETTRQMSLLQFGAFVPAPGEQTGSFKGLFFGEKPKHLAFRVKNVGNVAEEPKGSIVIKDFSGKRVYSVQDINYKKQLALRGQTRRIDVCINREDTTNKTPDGTEINTVVCGDTDKFTPGRYKAELVLLYGGEDNTGPTRELNATATFWYLPWWFIGLVVLAVGLVIGAGVYLYHKVDAYRGRKTRRRRK